MKVTAIRFAAGFLPILAAALAAGTAWAGGSGRNIILVVNQNSTNSLQLGNEYCEKRGVPAQNVFRMTGWTGSAIVWNRSDFEARLRNPLLEMISSRSLTNQIEFVLLSMDIPYRVLDGTSQNSTTSALFYGFKNDTAPPGPGLPASCSLPTDSRNRYAFSELPFAEARPDTATTNSFLAMMLTDTTLAGAELILNGGIASDRSFPTQTVCLARTSDAARNVRYVEFDNAIFDTRIRGDNSLIRLDTSSTSFTNLLGLFTGLAGFSLPVNAFVPGAMSDNLTSFGGEIFENSGQTTLLAFLNAGASGSYGTVVEPCNYLEKFPNPIDYFYQNRGFSLAEAYYQSIQNPYQGLLVGEPLSAPFALPGTADWSSLTNGSILVGDTPLSLTFVSGASNLPIGKVDLFLDGNLIRNVTNLVPAAGNVLSVSLNGFTTSYTVPLNATVASATSGLAAALNEQTNFTYVIAYPTGDRLELQSLDPLNPGTNVTLSVSTSSGSAPQQTTHLTAARATFLESAAVGHLGVLVSNVPVVGDWLQFDFIKTNGTSVKVGVTNIAGGTTIGAFAQSLINKVNSSGALQSADGVSASEFFAYSGIAAAEFTLYARTPGWAAARLQVALTASTNLLVLPSGTNRLEDNLSDLRPRNHLYVCSGLASLSANFVLETAQFPDGFHELLAVASEGTSVRTQTPISRKVRFQNTSLTATFASLLAQTNATLDTMLQFAITANSTNVSLIELFSTGGSVAWVSNQSAAIISASASSLGIGLHPFYALVTDSFGGRYRTQTEWLRVIPSFKLTITDHPLLLSWPSTLGQRYDILATTNLSTPFQVVASVTASNSTVHWTASNSGASTLYRVRLAY
jgi:uncharacterized protein (TIGR03790 family)